MLINPLPLVDFKNDDELLGIINFIKNPVIPNSNPKDSLYTSLL